MKHSVVLELDTVTLSQIEGLIDKREAETPEAAHYLITPDLILHEAMNIQRRLARTDGIPAVLDIARFHTWAETDAKSYSKCLGRITCPFVFIMAMEDGAARIETIIDHMSIPGVPLEMLRFCD